MKISLIQSEQQFTYDPTASDVPSLGECRAAAQPMIDEGFDLMDAAARDGADLLITIEAFNVSIRPDDPRVNFADAAEPLDGPLMARFCALAKKHGVYIVGGLYTGRDGSAYNSAVLFGPRGNIAGVFDKVHMPGTEHFWITRGDNYPVFETEHGNVGMLVCWDLQYPEAARELALGGADLIAVPTWGWEKRYGLCRAYENSVTIAAAMGIPRGGQLWDFCDPSCVVNNMGEVIAEGTRAGSQTVTAEVDIRGEPEPQYGAGPQTGMNTMRQIRLAQRRPDTYRLVSQLEPPVYGRYDSMTLPPGPNET